MTRLIHHEHGPELPFQAETHYGTTCALGTIGRAPAWTERRHQQFARVAAHFPVCLHGSKSSKYRIALVTLIAFVTFFAWRSLRSLRPLRASLALRARNALDALSPLGSGGPLDAGLALRAWAAATGTKREGKNNNSKGNDFHNSASTESGTVDEDRSGGS